MQVETLQEAFEMAKEAEWSNGMATQRFIVDREYETIGVMRKSGSLDHPEIFLVIAEPKHGYKMPNIPKLQSELEEIFGLYGDINVKMKGRDRNSSRSHDSYDCVLPVDLFRD